MRIAVTGATGNVGTSVVQALSRSRQIDSIVGLARRSPDWPLPKLEMVFRDIEHDDLVEVFDGADAVVHLAWRTEPTRNDGDDFEADIARTNVAGARRVFESAIRAGVGCLIHASSVGVYGTGPKNDRVDESWPLDDVGASIHARQKIAVERVLDELEERNPDMRIVRMRPAMIFKRPAVCDLQRSFLAGLLPRTIVASSMPTRSDPRFAFQCVHASDVAQAYLQAAVQDVHGSFNLAADPEVDCHVLGRALGVELLQIARHRLPRADVAPVRNRSRQLADSWVHLAAKAPLMDTDRILDRLKWTARHDSVATLRELIHGLSDEAPSHAGSSRSTRGATGQPAPSVRWPRPGSGPHRPLH